MPGPAAPGLAERPGLLQRSQQRPELSGVPFALGLEPALPVVGHAIAGGPLGRFADRRAVEGRQIDPLRPTQPLGLEQEILHGAGNLAVDRPHRGDEEGAGLVETPEKR